MNEQTNGAYNLPSQQPVSRPGAWRRRATGASLLAGGLLIGGVLAGTLSAGATTPTPSTTSEEGTTDGQLAPVDPSQPHRADEELLTGDPLARVTEAVLAEYPGATIERAETDSDGVYEAHLVTADGERLTVQLDADFAVTGTEAGGGPGCGPGGRGGDGPGAVTPEGTTTQSSSYFVT